MAKTPNELRQERAAHIVSMRGILDVAEAENRAPTAEERQEYDRLETAVDELAGRIKMQEAQRDRELELATNQDRGFDPRQAQGDPTETETRGKAYATAFDKYIRCGFDEMDREERQILHSGRDEARADQIKGTTTLGGFTVPTSFEAKLVEHQVQSGAMRQTRATILQTGSGEDLQVPKTTGHGAALWLSEGAAVTIDNETFGQVTLKSFVVHFTDRVSIQLLQDTAVDLEGYLARALAGNIGRTENTAYVVGDGSGKPTGISTLSTLGVTAAAAAAIATDELLDLYYAVIPEYRRQGEWLMADLTIKAVRKLKLSTGEYIWSAGLTVNEPDTLLGKRVWDDPDVPALATGNKTVLFGDLSAYWIRDTGTFVLRRLDERYADNLLVGFLAYHRTDGNLIDQSGAVKHLRQA